MVSIKLIKYRIIKKEISKNKKIIIKKKIDIIISKNKK
jgi:hypothetical protein